MLILTDRAVEAVDLQDALDRRGLPLTRIMHSPAQLHETLDRSPGVFSVLIMGLNSESPEMRAAERLAETHGLQFVTIDGSTTSALHLARPFNDRDIETLLDSLAL
ncbi:MAG: hypothetical protein ACU0CO_10505 [Shimia sp.]